MSKLKIKLDGTSLSLNSNGIEGNYVGGAGITMSGNEVSRDAAAADVLTIEDHANNDHLANAESGSVHTNLGAAGLVTLELPDPGTEGVFFIFTVCVVQQLRVDPQSATIRIRNGQVVGKYCWADNEGDTITLIADGNGDWCAISETGAWNIEV